ncbi:elongation factor P [Mesomycoplasma neurolyticum]|uniref:Elongation factor P n=1 Tax=Mesomycoplasma neurolyticum TaxID=2120 RepID=A0A449A4B7_9BACT|nr:elongation factor P [Mesomycoplasma neurolyticum]VEU59087.1 elongation factor P [Mesomycoplasma neurolyticum]
MINVNDFKPGITFQENNDIFIVLESQHSKQGRGQATVKAKVKNLRTGAVTNKSFTGGTKIAKAHIEKVGMNYLFNDGTGIVLMDENTFEQVTIPNKNVEWEMNFLKDGQKVIVRKFKEEILDIELPINIELKVIEAPEAVRGNTATNPHKKIKLETGFETDAPMFIKEGETIIVSTETGKYVGRANK